MDSVWTLNDNSVYIERLHQAKRVLREMSTNELLKFNINVFADKSADGIEACIAGLCGLDPWFEERGFITNVDKNRIDIVATALTTQEISHDDPYQTLEDFFGTERPFFRKFYPEKSESVSVEDAIAALDREIGRLACTSVGAAEQ